jgi:peptidoglycan/LPS O-acetylase OafA/YrhL
VFLIGMLIHDALRAPPAKRGPFLGAVALASLQFYRYGYWSLLMLAFEASLYVLWTRPVPQWLTDVLDNRFSRFMSDTSYSVYLLHGPFLAIAGSRIAIYLHDRHAPREQIVAAIFAAVAAATYASAYVFFRCIERPGIRLGRVVQNAIVKARPAA